MRKAQLTFNVSAISLLLIGSIILAFGGTSVVFIIGLILSAFTGDNWYK